jgi:hypothetical protein
VVVSSHAHGATMFAGLALLSGDSGYCNRYIHLLCAKWSWSVVFRTILTASVAGVQVEHLVPSKLAIASLLISSGSNEVLLANEMHVYGVIKVTL